jgi:hypothetical protein
VAGLLALRQPAARLPHPAFSLTATPRRTGFRLAPSPTPRATLTLQTTPSPSPSSTPPRRRSAWLFP